VDVDEKTDAKSLFEQYRKTVATLRAQHPEATLVHVTLPLETEPSRLRYWMNTVRSIPTTRDENAVRADYNQLLRAAYAGKEPIFDLAALESTRADGTIEYGILNGAKIPALANEWSSDGGHLNEAGRRRIAEQFLATLATLPAPGDPAVKADRGVIE
jgi:lysophospholipase L1-like esterase